MPYTPDQEVLCHKFVGVYSYEPLTRADMHDICDIATGYLCCGKLNPRSAFIDAVEEYKNQVDPNQVHEKFFMAVDRLASDIALAY